MQIIPIKYTDFSKKQNISNNSIVNFQRRQPLIPINIEDLQKESSKIIYSRIKKYLKLIGDSGKIEDIKVMRDKWQKEDSGIIKNDYWIKEADIYLSITRNEKNTRISLSRENSDISTKLTFFEAILNQDGQMFKGYYQVEKGNYFHFERRGTNVRRINGRAGVFFPTVANDRKWDSLNTVPYSSLSDWFRGPIKEDCKRTVGLRVLNRDCENFVNK